MFFKGVIIDLDNTLYNYDKTHIIALNGTFEYLSKITGENAGKIINDYNLHKKYLHKELSGTASSHNKLITFKYLCSKYGLSNSNIIEINNIYEDLFLRNIVINEGVYDFLEFLTNLRIKKCLLTNYVLRDQLKKLRELRLLDKFDHIISSEELGKEKPVQMMFLTALHRLNLQSNEVIMIGDNYDADINGANNTGNIYGCFFNPLNNFINIGVNFLTFSSFNDLLVFFEDVERNLNKFVEICKYCGMRFDLVQAGGGNISFKNRNLLFIKESGIGLSDVSTKNGYVIIKDGDMLSISKGKRASIETHMHKYMYKYVIHLHPIQVNMIGICENGKEVLNKLFPNSLVIDYVRPGEDLGKMIAGLWNRENIIFLLNHGIIITTDNFDEIIMLIENVIMICEKYLDVEKRFMKYKNVSLISELFQDSFVYLCDDEYVNGKRYLLNNDMNTNPDKVVYCGVSVCYLQRLDMKYIKDYVMRYGEDPKIVLYDDNIYIVSINMKKCKEIVDVLKANMMLLDGNLNDIMYLNYNEINFINNWDAERYRKRI